MWAFSLSKPWNQCIRLSSLWTSWLSKMTVACKSSATTVGKCGQLFACAPEGATSGLEPADYNSFCPRLGIELDGLVTSLGQRLESAGDGWTPRLVQGCSPGQNRPPSFDRAAASTLHSPFQFPFLPLSQFERFGRVAQPLAGHCAPNLFERSTRTVDVASCCRQVPTSRCLQGSLVGLPDLGNVPFGYGVGPRGGSVAST